MRTSDNEQGINKLALHIFKDTLKAFNDFKHKQ